MIPLQLRVNDTISIQQCEFALEGRSSCIIIMGPTGSGKSSFIEALAGENHSLGISYSGLAGFTQDVVAYEAENIALLLGSPDNDKELWPVYLIDTPGFSAADSEISEMEIITKVDDWMSNCNIGHIGNVLYFCPITDTRVSGSKRRTIKLLQSLLQKSSAKRLTIVTTMWDRLGNTRAEEQAESRFSQLREDIWKDLVDSGAQVERFHNTYVSALSIIKAALESYAGEAPLRHRKITSDHPSAPFLYQELLDQIDNAQLEKELSHKDQIELIIEPDPKLEPIVLRKCEEVGQGLTKFLEQLVAFGAPPQGFEGVAEWYFYRNLLAQTEEARKEIEALNFALQHLHVQTYAEREPILKDQLERIKRGHASNLENIARYGSPPELPQRYVTNHQSEIVNTGISSWQSFQDTFSNHFTHRKDKFSVRFKHGSQRLNETAKAPTAVPDHEVDLDLVLESVEKDREESRALQFALAHLTDRGVDWERVPILRVQIAQVEARIAERLSKVEEYRLTVDYALNSAARKQGSISTFVSGTIRRLLNRIPQK